jgi:FkbM family methyltransferase
MITVRHKIKRIVEKVTKLHIYRVLPRGINELYDIKALLPKSTLNVIFDVGANIGQSSKQYIAWYPNARIYSFEPVSSVYNKLQNNMRKYDNILTFQLAFSSAKGQANISCDSLSSECNSLVANNISKFKANSEIVNLDTIDEFCNRENIVKIDFLKVDTEGHDLEVLKGAEKMLSKQMINMVQVEAGMNPKNNKFVSYDQFKNYLENMGYYLFGIYEQVNEHYNGEPQLRRSNLVYISDNVISLNRISS